MQIKPTFTVKSLTDEVCKAYSPLKIASFQSNKIKINQIVQSKAQNYINKYLDGLSSDKSILKDDTTVVSLLCCSLVQEVINIRVIS